MKNIEDTFSTDYKKALESAERHELANEFLAYKTKSDKNDSNYQVINSIIDYVNNSDLSNTEWAKKYKMTDTDLKSVEFYHTLNRRKLSPESASPSYLRVAILDAFHYDKLKGKNQVMKDYEGNILLDENENPRHLKISEPLECTDATKIRSFSIKSYYHGEKVIERITRK